MSDAAAAKKRPNEGGAGGGDKKKKKGHYTPASKPADKAIPSGVTGILLTSDAGRERRAAEELTLLLEESFSRLGKDHVGRSAAGGSAAAAAAEGGDGAAQQQPQQQSVAAMLAAEVAELKDKRTHRFRRHDTQVRGTIFIEFPKADDCPTPEQVVVDIAQHVKATRSLPARFVLRVLPVAHTCFVSQEEVAALAATVAGASFPADAEPGTFSVDFEHRSCDKLKRKEVIDLFAKAVPQPPFKVNLTAPQRTIVVQLVRNVAAVGVVDGFKSLARLNLRKLAEDDEEEQPQKQQQQQQPAQEKAAAAQPAQGQPAGDQKGEAAE